MSKENDSEFDKFVDELQKQIYDDEKRDFSEKLLAEYYNPHNFGRMEAPSTHAKLKGQCGTMEFFLKVNETKKITKATFFTDGCGTTIACGSMTVKLIENKSLDEVKKITKEDLKSALGGIPPENEHCATLAIKTLKETIENYEKNKSLQ